MALLAHKQLRVAGTCQRASTSVARPAFSRSAPRRSAVVVRAEAGPVNDGDFKDKVLDSAVPVLVDFWAPWCGPCRMIAPIVDELAKEYSGKLTCFKLNTDESPNVASEYGIRSIPTIMIFKGGKKLDTIIGAVPKGTIQQTIVKYI